MALLAQWWIGECGDLPVAGSWIEGLTSELGVYLPKDDVPGVFGHLLLEGESAQMINDLGNDIERAWPLAGDWLAKGKKDHVGIFDLDTRTLWHRPASGGAVGSTWVGVRGARHTLPLSVDTGNGRGEVVLGLFDPRKGHGQFHFFRVNTESYEDPLPLEVVVDPTGGPWVPPS